MVVVDAVAKVQCCPEAGTKQAWLKDVVSCECRGSWEKSWEGSQAGKVGHDTSGWLVTKGLQGPIHCRRAVGGQCVTLSGLAGEKKEGCTTAPNPEVPRHLTFNECRSHGCCNVTLT